MLLYQTQSVEGQLMLMDEISCLVRALLYLNLVSSLWTLKAPQQGYRHGPSSLDQYSDPHLHKGLLHVHSTAQSSEWFADLEIR